MADSESVQILNRFEDGVDELRSLVFWGETMLV